MLSWSSTGRTRGAAAAASSSYPGSRSGSATTTATTVQGTVRPPNSSGHSRSQHLESYLKDDILGRSTMKVSQDDTTYDTVFATVAEDTLILRVHFPAAVSSSVTRPPDMQLKGVVATHPWLDNIGRIVGFDPISSERAFRESRILLGQAVKQVVQELQLNPPVVSEFTDSHLESMQPRKKRAAQAQRKPPAPSRTLGASDASNESDSPPSYETLLGSGAAQVDLPSIPTNFPDLETMDRTALDEMLNNDVVFLDYCNNLPVTSELQKLVADKYEQLVSLASENLSRQTELQELHNSTKAVHEQLKMVVEEFKTLEQQQDALLEKPDPQVLIRELTQARRRAYEDSEKMAEAWLLQGERCAETMDEFCRAFLEERKIHHLRAAKVQILSQQQQHQ
ncbi:hypothetical protein ACA910_004994 [Epithemia clementina (nom. ined.)]